MKKVHYISGLTIAIFICLHLFNHLYSLFGIEAHIRMMDSLRLIYRNAIAETILLLAVSVQIFTGVKLFLIKKKTATGFFDKLQIWSGLYLAFFFVFHLAAVFGGRLVLALDTNFYFGAAGLNTFPFNLFFVPYYGLAIISFFGHIAAVHSRRMRIGLLGIRPASQSHIILLIGCVLTVIILYGLTNRFQGFEIPSSYNVLIGK